MFRVRFDGTIGGMDSTPTAPRVEHRVEFARSSSDRMLFGVCGGAARRYGVDVYVVRIALLLLTLTGGLGVILYIVGFALSRSPDELPAPKVVEPGVVSRKRHRSAGTGACGPSHIGLWSGDAIMVPAIVVAAVPLCRGTVARPTPRGILWSVCCRAGHPAACHRGVAPAMAGVVAWSHVA
jgi:phage shock protein PspC (stress-responsive transcriptional regulator)